VKVRLLHGLEFLWVGFIKILCCLYGIGLITTCQTTNNPPVSQEKQPQEEQNEYADTESSQENYQIKTLPHPKKPNKLSLSHFLVQSTLPDQEKIHECLAKLDAVSRDHYTEQDVFLALERILEEVTTEEALVTYHFCYYQFLEHLQHKLLEVQLTLDQKSKIFLETMKQLWILGATLERRTQNKVYLDYLREYYISLQKEFFGTEVIPYGPFLRPPEELPSRHIKSNLHKKQDDTQED
jgi:hypothetical protein